MLFLRSPVGRAVSFLFSLGLAAILYFVLIKPAVDEADKESKQDPTAVSPEKSLYKAGNFEKALDKVRGEEGANAEMLEVVVRPRDAEFQVRKGEKADGYRYDAESGDLQAVDVKIVGSGTLEGRQFSLRRVPPGITAKLAAAVREENPGARATNMALKRGVTDGRLIWTVNAEGGGRTGLVYNARPNGGGFAEPTAFARGGRPGGRGVGDAQKQAQCLQRAAGDVAKVQACLR